MSDSSTVVAFEGGLDMVTPVQNTAPGTLVDCLNYEVGPIKGYRRIDGYERFDGSIGGGIVNLYSTTMEPFNPSFEVEVGDVLSLYGQDKAVVVDVVDEQVFYVPTAPGNKLNTATSYSIRHSDGGLTSGVEITSDTVDTRDTAADYDEYITQLRAAQVLLRSYVKEAPNNISGVYFGRTQAYAVVDMVTLQMALASDTLEAGQYVRIDTYAYRVAYVEGHVVWLSRLPVVHTAVTDIHVVNQQQAYAGTPGSLSVITGWSYETLPELFRYGQPHVVDHGFTPLYDSITVTFDNATVAFPDTVRLTDSVGDYGAYTVVGYRIDAGSFSGGDASGVIYLTPLPGSSMTGFTGVFDGAVEITDTSATPIADVLSIGSALWPGTATIRGSDEDPEQTFYQWGTYNFRGTRDKDMVFTTNGKMPAGWIAEMDFGFIHYGNIITNPDDPESDNPKYLAFHSGQRLALGFANGSLQLSAIAQPLNFSGFDGAIEIGNGDNITGLLEASGDSTLVFGPRSIRRVIGEGTSLALRTISSQTGALDYTATVVAGTPLYVNHNGLCTLDQTAAYGDFQNSSISGAIDPFFTPRIVQEASTIELGGTVCAFPVRSKNQYRLFLGDGSVVSMSLTTVGPQPMLSCYSPASGSLRVPLAYSSSVSDLGYEYLLCVWDAVKSESNGAPGDPPQENIIYRLDNGWGFDGETFAHYIDTAYMFNQNPTFLTIDRAILYGMCYGVATLRLMAAGVEDVFEQDFDTTVQDISMPRNPIILHKQLERSMGNVDHANWGRAIKLRFSNITEAGATTTEPSHILQSIRLFVQTEGIPEN